MSDTKVGNISLSCKYSLPKVYTECLSLLFSADIFFSLIQQMAHDENGGGSGLIPFL